MRIPSTALYYNKRKYSKSNNFCLKFFTSTEPTSQDNRKEASPIL